MTEAAKYSAVEQLRDGREIEIRALRPVDEEAMLAAIDPAPNPCIAGSSAPKAVFQIGRKRSSSMSIS